MWPSAWHAGPWPCFTESNRATAGKRIEDRVTLHIPTANFPYSIIDPKAKPGDKFRIEPIARFRRDS